MLLSRPSRGGLTDPNMFLRYALPQFADHWRGNVEIGLKIPLMNTEKFLSTGSWDFGYQLTIDKHFEYNAWLLNMGVIYPGKFTQSDFNPPSLPFINISWLHRFKHRPNTRSFVQVLLAEHPYHASMNSALSDMEFQITAGFKWHTHMGIFGLGMTENVLNFDNTPDIGLHLTWGYLK